MSIIPALENLVPTRGIAQSGSALALGARCREFKSLYPDQFSSLLVTVAQLVEPRTVTPVVVGSSPIGHPIFLLAPAGTSDS
jgi:hypothetical protein